jgi:hypothetical protein
MITPDITADLNDQLEPGIVWTFLDEARDPALITPGRLVIAGDPDASAVCEVDRLEDHPNGTMVHLRILPGRPEDYERLLRRSGARGRAARLLAGKVGRARAGRPRTPPAVIAQAATRPPAPDGR